MKMNFLSLDSLHKDALAKIIGGAAASTNKKCGCVCFGPLKPGEGDDDDDDDVDQPVPGDGDCADCGASNAFRVTPEQ